MSKAENRDDNRELIKALDEIEKEKEISKEVMLKTIEESLLTACKNQFGKSDNVKVSIDRYSGEVKVYTVKTVVEDVMDELTEISVSDADDICPGKQVGDEVEIIVTPKNFGRIAAQKAKQVVVQKIRELK